MPSRQEDLEQRFAVLYVEKARHEEQVRLLHDDLMRIQGALAELSRPPDSPPAG